jgi:hypothetical protein
MALLNNKALRRPHRVLFKSGGGRILRIPSLGDESARGYHAIPGGRFPGPIALQERVGPRASFGGGVCAERQYRTVRRSGSTPRRNRRLHDFGAIVGYSKEICHLEPHGIGNGPVGEAGHPRGRRQPLGCLSAAARTAADGLLKSMTEETAGSPDADRPRGKNGNPGSSNFNFKRGPSCPIITMSRLRLPKASSGF